MQPVVRDALAHKLADERSRQQQRRRLHGLPQRTDRQPGGPFDDRKDRFAGVRARCRAVRAQRVLRVVRQAVRQRVHIQDLPFLLQNIQRKNGNRQHGQNPKKNYAAPHISLRSSFAAEKAPFPKAAAQDKS